MSLTSTVKTKEIREKMNEFFPRPKIRLQGDIKASPLSKNYGLVGTAADYLIRFNIKYFFPKTKESKWVAESAEQHLRICKVFNGKETLRKYTTRARNNYNQFLLDGKLTKDLIMSSIDLAKIDIVFRCGYYGNDIGEYNKNDIIDLKRVIKSIDFEKIIPKRRCILNPTFGSASFLVGGADADLILDNMLVDIKTSKELKITRLMLNQLIGYYFLGLIGKVKGVNDWSSINKLGFFFSRYDKLYIIPVKNIIAKNKVCKFKKWFVENISVLQ